MFFRPVQNNVDFSEISETHSKLSLEVRDNEAERERSLAALEEKVAKPIDVLIHINEEAVTTACFTLRGARELDRLGADCQNYARNNGEILERSIRRECERLMRGVSSKIGTSGKCAIAPASS